MSRRGRIFRVLLSVLLGVGLFGAVGVFPAFAQDQPPRDTACTECHQDQYFHYDRGRYYCLCKTRVRCTECHAGRTDTQVEALAHEGLIANPLENGAAVCQSCHPEDYRARVEKFAAVAGVRATPHPCPTCTPPIQDSLSSVGGGDPTLRALPPGPWQAAGAVFLGIGFLAVLLISRRGWRSDQLFRNQGEL